MLIQTITISAVSRQILGKDWAKIVSTSFSAEVHRIHAVHVKMNKIYFNVSSVLLDSIILYIYIYIYIYYSIL